MAHAALLSNWLPPPHLAVFAAHASHGVHFAAVAICAESRMRVPVVADAQNPPRIRVRPLLPSRANEVVSAHLQQPDRALIEPRPHESVHTHTNGKIQRS